MSDYQQQDELAIVACSNNQVSEVPGPFRLLQSACRVISSAPVLGESIFLTLKENTVIRLENVKTQWNEREEAEFDEYTSHFRSIYSTLKNELSPSE